MQHPSPTIFAFCSGRAFIRRLAYLACALIGAAASQPAVAAESQAWELAPYGVRILLAVDDSDRPRPGLEASLLREIAERISVSLSPLWKTELELASTGAERRQCFDPQEIGWEELADARAGQDKVFWLGVKSLPDGYELTCREFDVYLRRWGPLRRKVVRQESYLGEASFSLLKSAFSPLALISAVEDDATRVQLAFKGSRLPNPSGESLVGHAGDAFLPLLRRTDRAGKLVEQGIQPVPWTYLTLADENDAGRLADVHSGMRRAFGGVKRGTVEQIAIAIGPSASDSRVRFHSRTDPRQGLAGYEVFRATPTGETLRVGVTDRDGLIVVPMADERVSMLLLRSDGQLLAKTPIVNGQREIQQMPIADSVTRLQAQAEAQVVREELIDLVARRAIMMGRVKSMLKQGRVDDAKELMAELNEMPSPSVFDRRIENAVRRVQTSDDPSVQKRIDSLFASTREMLSKFLGTREISLLQNQVDSAAGSAPATSEQPAAEEAAPANEAVPS